MYRAGSGHHGLGGAGSDDVVYSAEDDGNDEDDCDTDVEDDEMSCTEDQRSPPPPVAWPQSAFNPAASLITYCPCGCGKEDHNGGGDSSASSTGGTPGSLPSPNNLATIVRAAANLTSLHMNSNNQQHLRFPESPDLSPVKPFQLSTSSTTSSGVVTGGTVTQPPFHLLQPVPTASTAATNNISPQSSSSYSSSSEVPLDMSKTSPMFTKHHPLSTTSLTSSSSIIPSSATAKVCTTTIQTPPPTPPENDRDKFRCLYLLVDAAMEQLEEMTAEKKRKQEVSSSLQITIPTHNPPTQQRHAALHPHQQVCA
jgi:hypothetical protein